MGLSSQEEGLTSVICGPVRAALLLGIAMTRKGTGFSSTARHYLRTAGLTAIVSVVVATGTVASAQGFRIDFLAMSPVIRVQGDEMRPETVRLLSGLAKIESDLLLGNLFAHDGLSNPEGSHFTHPRKETYPEIKEGLVAAGVPDFEEALMALEAGGDAEAVMAAFKHAEEAIVHARATLKPTGTELAASIMEQTRAAVAEINASGPTEVASYQDAWAMLMIARSEVDLLIHNEDPALRKASGEMAMALDDVILSMPDPAARGPVEFDPTPIVDAFGKLEALVGSV